MPARLLALSIDALDPEHQAGFWSAALGWEVDGTDLVAPGIGFRVAFRQVDAPKAERNRIHIDVTTTSLDDQRETVERLLALGASHLDVGQGPDDDHAVLADPEGNELCILAPGNRFLDGCGRLGAINCDGLRATGVFWSEALGLPLVWDQDEETAIRHPDPGGPMITWSGPPLLPKPAKNRLHLDLAPVDGDLQAEVERLLALGATRVDVGQGDAAWAVLADPDDNELCVYPR